LTELSMKPLQSVHVATLPAARFQEVLDPPQWEMLEAATRHAREIFGDRRVWSINSTATGGGVAEMLQSLIAYARGAGVDARWSTIDGEPDFFAITKRIHHKLHGSGGDGGPLGPAEHEIYARVTRANGERLAAELLPGDVLLLHDPQTVGMIPVLAPASQVHIVWRSHIGVDEPNEHVEEAWDFLLPYLGDTQALIFTRRKYVPPELAERDLTIIPPSIDVFSQKNQPMTEDQVVSILAVAGIVDAEATAPPTYLHHDGRVGSVGRRAVMDEDERLGPADRIVLQVSRWDPLKDPLGVMEGFVQNVAPHVPDVRLVLAGPSPAGVTDDPEGALVLEQVRAARAALAPEVRRRVHLASLPMEDRSENAAIVNALQRRATIVVQKSLAEGFGLTVAEAMWKDRPVVASRVGGIQDQIVDGVSGVLLDDPHDLEAYGSAVATLLADPELMTRMGDEARERVRAEFLGSRHLIQYLGLFARLIHDDGHGSGGGS
jgi:trehalose synthase